MQPPQQCLDDLRRRAAEQRQGGAAVPDIAGQMMVIAVPAIPGPARSLECPVQPQIAPHEILCRRQFAHLVLEAVDEEEVEALLEEVLRPRR